VFSSVSRVVSWGGGGVRSLSIVGCIQLWIISKNQEFSEKRVSFPVAVKDEEEKNKEEGALLTDFLQVLYTHWHGGYNNDAINTFCLKECGLWAGNFISSYLFQHKNAITPRYMVWGVWVVLQARLFWYHSTSNFRSKFVFLFKHILSYCMRR
jgi:hypothetical protein